MEKSIEFSKMPANLVKIKNICAENCPLLAFDIQLDLNDFAKLFLYRLRDNSVQPMSQD